uniref:GPI ethanolamine phosphate transferase 1 n=2 Tax=Timema TaxID=61471 RepID=A0A7R9IRB6_9NEOP|nr:unnamed protein product [Timema tahoe]
MSWLILNGIFVHIVFLLSIFDIYFKSPIVHGIGSISNPLPAPSKRIILFVADGLRAETFFHANFGGGNHASYLRRVMNSSGAWGVSHTRVPTESRPGHVAIIAGLYEDPSAIAKGWKENPVEFDSLFNQSRFTWSWGSPDILPMFARGASGDHVLTEMYGPEVEDFSGKNKTSVLDTWVFDRVELFLHSAKSDPVLLNKLQQDNLVFFLHLLGLDTAGHSHKPHSKEYLENIKVVDEGVKKMEQLFEEFYNHDERTTYIFTSDHGMTDWGSHGAGERSETETPLVAWGAGIRRPLPATETDPLSPQSWELAHVRRSDVRQADIAPLMATLLGVPIPANSVGFLPREYLSLSELEVSEAVFTNARQMAAQYNRKKELTESGTISILYRPFPQLTKYTEQTLMTEIRKHIEDGQFTHAINASSRLFSLSLAGLDYYQNYYQCLLLTCVSLSFLGWLLWLLLPPPSSSAQPLLPRGGYFLNMVFMVGTVLTSLLIYGGYVLDMVFMVGTVLTSLMIHGEIRGVRPRHGDHGRNCAHISHDIW